VLALNLPDTVLSDDIYWWDGFDLLGLSDGVRAFIEYDAALLACGFFREASDEPAKFIASWDGTSWSPFGDGLGGPVYALSPYQGGLAAGGDFSTTGTGASAKGVAFWDGSVWEGVGDGVQGFVRALAVSDDFLFAGGRFWKAGAETVGNIACWDGTSWESLGEGFNNDVNALTFYDGHLVAAGRFTEADGVPIDHIASWDGYTWQPLGLGINGTIYALEVSGDCLIAGGNFTRANGDFVRNIARWDGSSWSSMGEGIYGFVWSLATYDEDLIAGGLFSSAGESQALCVARWDGETWSGLGSGVDAQNRGGVYALSEYKRGLYAGGSFHIAGQKPSHNVALWDSISPRLAVGVFQNPYLTQYLDLYLIGSEPLDSTSLSLEVGGHSVQLRSIDRRENLWMADFSVSTPAESLSISACGTDLVGNETCVDVECLTQWVSASEGGEVWADGGGLLLSIGAGVLPHDAHILVSPCREEPTPDHNYLQGSIALLTSPLNTEGGGHRAYRIGPKLSLNGEAYLELRYDESGLESGVTPDQLYIEQEEAGCLECVVDVKQQTVGAQITRFGSFYLRVGEPGRSRLRDRGFFRVVSIAPNPFVGVSLIQFEIRAPQRLSVTVYSIEGREVRRLTDCVAYPGTQTVVWDGKSADGRRVAGGVYVVRFVSETGTHSAKIVLVR
jgi:hypothetical protein